MGFEDIFPKGRMKERKLRKLAMIRHIKLGKVIPSFRTLDMIKHNPFLRVQVEKFGTAQFIDHARGVVTDLEKVGDFDQIIETCESVFPIILKMEDGYALTGNVQKEEFEKIEEKLNVYLGFLVSVIDTLISKHIHGSPQAQVLMAGLFEEALSLAHIMAPKHTLPQGVLSRYITFLCAKVHCDHPARHVLNKSLRNLPSTPFSPLGITKERLLEYMVCAVDMSNFIPDESPGNSDLDAIIATIAVADLHLYRKRKWIVETFSGGRLLDSKESSSGWKIKLPD
jgi:hypothetical protein